MSGRKAVTADGRPKQYTAARMFFLIVAATLPLVLILPINDYIGELSQSTVFVGIALILTGFMLLVSDKMTAGTKTEKNMRFSDALIIGLCQCVATLPGLSRSGTTITAGIATGQNRGYAVKFSLLMSIPAVLGATLLELIKAIKTGIDASLIPAYLFGMVAAMVSGVSGDRTPQNDSEEQALRRLCLLLLDSRRTHDNSFHDILIKAGIA